MITYDDNNCDNLYSPRIANFDTSPNTRIDVVFRALGANCDAKWFTCQEHHAFSLHPRTVTLEGSHANP